MTRDELIELYAAGERDFAGANLSMAHLSGAELSGAELIGANLSWANLRWANLRGADLSWASLRMSDLSGANLGEITVNWQSHDLIAEILIRAAGEDVEKRSLAGLVLVSRDWCWEQFLATGHPQREWALAELRKWVRDGDGAPEVLREAKAGE